MPENIRKNCMLKTSVGRSGFLASENPVQNKVITPFVQTLREDLDVAVSLGHSHDNKELLDTINAAKVAAWDTVADKADKSAFAAVATSGRFGKSIAF